MPATRCGAGCKDPDQAGGDQRQQQELPDGGHPNRLGVEEDAAEIRQGELESDDEHQEPDDRRHRDVGDQVELDHSSEEGSAAAPALRGRTTPSFFIRERRVLGLSARISAAPPGPLIFQPQPAHTARM